MENDRRDNVNVGHRYRSAQPTRWKLLAENKDGFSSGTPLQIARADGTKIPVRLGGIWLVKNRFTIFDISSPVL